MHRFGKSSALYTMSGTIQKILIKKTGSQTLSSQNQQDKENNLRIQNLKVNMQNVFL